MIVFDVVVEPVRLDLDNFTFALGRALMLIDDRYSFRKFLGALTKTVKVRGPEYADVCIASSSGSQTSTTIVFALYTSMVSRVKYSKGAEWYSAIPI